MVGEINIPDIYFDEGALVMQDGMIVFNPLYSYFMFKGGRGRGGSWTMITVAVMMAMQETMTILIVRATKSAIRDSVWGLVRDTAIRLGCQSLFKFTDKHILLPNGSKFIYDHMHRNEEGLKSKNNIRLCLGEEAQVYEKKPVLSLKSTIMRIDGAQFVGCMNPIDGKEAVENYIVQDEDCKTVTATYKDNPFAPAELVRDAEKLMRNSIEDYNDIYLGLVNTISKEHVFRAKCVQEYIVPIDNEIKYYGIDWGFAETGDPTTFVVTSLRNDDILIHEAYFFYNSDPDKIRDFLVDYRDTKGIDNTIYSDSADSAMGKMLKKAGLPVSYSWGKDTIQDRIRWFRSHRRIVINTDLPEMWEEAEMYKYPVDRMSGAIIPKPIDKYNHGWDGAAYSLRRVIKRGKL